MGLKFQTSNNGLVFLVTSPIQELTQSPLLGIKDTPLTQEIPWFQELGAETNIYFLLSHYSHLEKEKI